MHALVKAVFDGILIAGIRDFYSWVIPVHISNYQMLFDQKTIANEQIWSYYALERQINTEILFAMRNNPDICYNAVDSIFLKNPRAWTDYKLVVSDNIPMQETQAKFVPLYPEYWHIYHYQPRFQNRVPTHTICCFMNRISEDRNQMFELLKQNNLLITGLVSFNCLRPGNVAPTPEDIDLYGQPFNNLINSLEQCIVDSRIQIVLETYIDDNHIAFSEKIFRALQLPRPWLLYCSPKSVTNLRQFGFDVLDDHIDHSYDFVLPHHDRFQQIFSQAKTFVDRNYSDQDLVRFDQAAQHNRQRLAKLALAWPDRLACVLKEISHCD
jgi:hypothetical protein